MKTINEVKKVQMIALSAGIGSGTKLFHSLLDGHPELIMLPGYQLMYFYPHMQEWFESDCPRDWETALNYIFIKHPSLLDSRIMPGSETMDKLGENHQQYIEIDKDKFVAALRFAYQGSSLSTRNLLIAIHLAYHHLLYPDIEISDFPKIMYHIHDPRLIHKFLAKDFPGLTLLSMIRDPRPNINRRVENSVLKGDLEKLCASDYLLYKYRAFSRIVEELSDDLLRYSTSFSNESGISRHFVIEHADLARDLEGAMRATCALLGTRWDDCLMRTTFNSIPWYSTFYNHTFSRGSLINPKVLSTSWKSLIHPYSAFIYDITFKEEIEFYGYGFVSHLACYVVTRNWLRRLCFVLPWPQEIQNLLTLISPIEYYRFIRASILEVARMAPLKDYSQNAYYKHKWLNEGLNLHVRRFHVSFLIRAMKFNKEPHIVGNLVYFLVSLFFLLCQSFRYFANVHRLLQYYLLRVYSVFRHMKLASSFSLPIKIHS
jgi:hypothetical protein